MNPNRRLSDEDRAASKETLRCVFCGSRDVEVRTVLLGGAVEYECQRCGFTERHDPRERRE